MNSKSWFRFGTLGTSLLYGALLYVAVQNWSVMTPLQIQGGQMITLSLGQVLLLSGSILMIANLLSFLRIYNPLQRRLKQFELRKEKAEIQVETTSDYTKALEQKVETLEKALQQALSKKTSSKH